MPFPIQTPNPHSWTLTNRNIESISIIYYLRNESTLFCVCCGITSKMEKCCLKLRKAKALYFKQHFDTEELIVYIEERSRSICYVILIQHCRESSLMHPHDFKNAHDCMVFFLKRNRFYSFNLRCKCLSFMLIK